MASQFSDYGQFATVTAANSNLDPVLWQMRVRKSARQRNVLREMIGTDDGNMPIVEVTDLRKGPGDTVQLNTIAPERGQGVLGENRMLDSVGKPHPGTFSVTIDYLRNMWAWTQKMRDMTVAGKAEDEVTSDITGDWVRRKEEDDIQMAFVRWGRLVDPSLQFFPNNATSLATLLSTDTMTTNFIEDAKGVLLSRGAKEIAIDKDVTDASIAKFIFFSPDTALRPLRRSTNYLQSLQQADTRERTNRLFDGKYGLWENMVIFPHNLVFDDAAGRQGSPLSALAKLGTAITEGTTTTITGGGHSVEADATLGDFFANFPGYLWKFTVGDSSSAATTSSLYQPADSGPHYACIYNLPGSTDAGSYEIISYTTGNDGRRLSSVTRGTPTTTGGVSGFGNVTAQAAGRFSFRHDAGSLIFPCTKNGVPYAHSVAMGANAMGLAKGKWSEEPTEWEDDGRLKASKEPFIKGWGVMSVRGVGPYRNAANRISNFCLVTTAAKIPGIKGPEAYTG